MDGPVEVDMGHQLMEMTWTPGGLLVDGLFDTFGSPIHDAACCVSPAATRATRPARCCRSRSSCAAVTSPSAWAKQKGENTTGEISTTLSYYKLVIGGEEIIEIDKPGYVFRVRGVDRMAERRQALGV